MLALLEVKPPLTFNAPVIITAQKKEGQSKKPPASMASNNLLLAGGLQSVSAVTFP